MIANYHTHTALCRHACGTEREYIENAIRAGFKILGFADHAPQFFDDDFVSCMRMSPADAPGYIATLRDLAREYERDIQILVGFEAEYYPQLFSSLQHFCRAHEVDYLIMGQHHLHDERQGTYVGVPHSDMGLLSSYVDEVIEGIQTGSFTYLAHPDICNFLGDEGWYEKEMTRLCTAAKQAGIPLEVNMLGLKTDRHYSSKRFFKIAKQCG
ncbi:MAG: PHP domain-containing protein, partial [Clostridia bacterium]|nr:PHP domain-containing protein [Clostridia bacterium]